MYSSPLWGNNIVSCMDKNKHCAAVFTDLPKAIDTVGHSQLIQRLCNIWFDSVACRLFQNYLSERFQYVKAGNISFYQ